MFTKLAGEPVWIIGEEGENILEVRVPTRILTPLFSVQEDVGVDEPLHNQIQVYLEALVECGPREGSEGHLYGVIRSHSILNGGNLLITVTIGLAFSHHELEPYFRERADPTYRRIRSVDCSFWGLPTYEGPPPPPEPPIKRISRYERKPVI
jgi:hypothetical protein